VSDSPRIRLQGVTQNNLKGIDLDLPTGSLIVVTGPSGSGKSSLAFDTIYAEGQRRYVETFSPYTRQFLDRMDKPRALSIEGIPIEQSNSVKTTRSTVGTITEINDYLKLLMARSSTASCPGCHRPISPESPELVAKSLISDLAGRRLLITFPVATGSAAESDGAPTSPRIPLIFSLFSRSRDISGSGWTEPSFAPTPRPPSSVFRQSLR
jgi:excinuclease ABC subunit A